MYFDCNLFELFSLNQYISVYSTWIVYNLVTEHLTAVVGLIPLKLWRAKPTTTIQPRLNKQFEESMTKKEEASCVAMLPFEGEKNTKSISINYTVKILHINLHNFAFYIVLKPAN